MAINLILDHITSQTTNTKTTKQWTRWQKKQTTTKNLLISFKWQFQTNEAAFFIKIVILSNEPHNWNILNFIWMEEWQRKSWWLAIVNWWRSNTTVIFLGCSVENKFCFFFLIAWDRIQDVEINLFFIVTDNQILNGSLECHRLNDRPTFFCFFFCICWCSMLFLLLLLLSLSAFVSFCFQHWPSTVVYLIYVTAIYIASFPFNVYSWSFHILIKRFENYLFLQCNQKKNETEAAVFSVQDRIIITNNRWNELCNRFQVF